MRGVVLVVGGSHVDQDAVHWLASCSRANIPIPVTNTPYSAILSHTIKTCSHSIAYLQQPLRHKDRFTVHNVNPSLCQSFPLSLSQAGESERDEEDHQ